MNPVVRIMTEKKIPMTLAMVKFLKQVGFYAFNRWARKQGFLLAYVLYIHRLAANEKNT